MGISKDKKLNNSSSINASKNLVSWVESNTESNVMIKSKEMLTINIGRIETYVQSKEKLNQYKVVDEEVS